MRKYSNGHSVPLSVAVFLATDNYDRDENTISATALLKPLRQIILSDRVPSSDAIVDVMAMVPSRMGSAIHDGIERAWKDNYQSALKALGYPASVINRVKINPDPDTLTDECIPVYLEQRSEKLIAGKRVSGKYDFVAEGRLEDFKSTSAYSWTSASKDEDYIAQGSIYRWLNPKIVTQDTMAIQFIFTDWSVAQAKSNPAYPQHKVMEKVLKLKSIQETENFVRNKLASIDFHKDTPEPELPLCTDKDLWRKDPEWKYYKNPAKTNRSTKNFTNKQEAYIRLAQDGNVGIVIEKPGQVVACKYCPAFPVCTQKDVYIASGELQL